MRFIIGLILLAGFWIWLLGFGGIFFVLGLWLFIGLIKFLLGVK